MGGLLIVALLHALDGTDEREDLGLLALEGTMAAQFLQRHIATTRGFERRLVCLCLKTRGLSIFSLRMGHADCTPPEEGVDGTIA